MNHPKLRPATLARLATAFLLPLLHAEQTGAARRLLAADDSTQRLAIIAPDGSVEWELKVGAIHDAWLLPNGNLLLQQGWRKVVWTYKDFNKFGNSMPVQFVLAARK